MDWIGSALIITAWFLISHKRRCGFLFNLVGSALWVLWAILQPAVSVAVVCAFYIFASVYGWLQWGKEER